MGDYNRTTREVKFEGLSREMKEAIDKHIELYTLGSILDDILICVETTSEKIKKGLFSGPGPKILVSVDILTPRWLVQVYKADNEAAFATSAQLRNITASDYEKSEFYALLSDTGVSLTGMFTTTSENSSKFLGLGKDEAGEKFKSALIEAAQKAKQ